MAKSGMSKRQSVPWAAGLLPGIAIGMALFRDKGGVAFGVAFAAIDRGDRPDRADNGE